MLFCEGMMYEEGIGGFNLYCRLENCNGEIGVGGRKVVQNLGLEF